MNILVVGGAGYIGSHQVEALCNNGDNVTVYDNLSTGHEKAIDKRAEFIKGDLRDIVSLVEVLIKKHIEVVMHFASLSIVSESSEKVLEYYDNNVNGMRILLEAMNKSGVNKLIFSSTAAIYGIPMSNPIAEYFKKNPESPYGETKYAMEKMVQWQAKTSDLNYVSLRYFNVAGTSNSQLIGEVHNPETHLIPNIISVAEGKKEYLKIYGNNYDTDDGTAIRDYIHVLDLVDAHILAMNYLNENNKSNQFNLGYGKGFSVLDLVSAVERVTKKEIPIKYFPKRKGDPPILIANSNKIKKVLDWNPKHNDLDEIVFSAWRFYRRYPYGY